MFILSLPAKPLSMHCARTQGFGLCTSIFDRHKMPSLSHMDSFEQRPVHEYTTLLSTNYIETEFQPNWVKRKQTLPPTGTYYVLVKIFHLRTTSVVLTITTKLVCLP